MDNKKRNKKDPQSITSIVMYSSMSNLGNFTFWGLSTNRGTSSSEL